MASPTYLPISLQVVLVLENKTTLNSDIQPFSLFYEKIHSRFLRLRFVIQVVDKFSPLALHQHIATAAHRIATRKSIRLYIILGLSRRRRLHSFPPQILCHNHIIKRIVVAHGTGLLHHIIDVPTEHRQVLRESIPVLGQQVPVHALH